MSARPTRQISNSFPRPRSSEMPALLRANPFLLRPERTVLPIFWKTMIKCSCNDPAYSDQIRVSFPSKIHTLSLEASTRSQPTISTINAIDRRTPTIFAIDRYENACHLFFNPISFIEKSRISLAEKLCQRLGNGIHDRSVYPSEWIKRQRGGGGGGPFVLFPTFRQQRAFKFYQLGIIIPRFVDYSIKRFRYSQSGKRG